MSGTNNPRPCLMVEWGCHNPVDIPLLIIIVLLSGTIGAFVAGLFPYPFGVLILSFLLIGRLFALAARKRGSG